MKKLLLLLMLMLSGIGWSQHKYNVKLDYNTKETLSNITENFPTYNRIVSDTMLVFNSDLLLMHESMLFICEELGYELLYFERVKSGELMFTMKSSNTDCPDATLICDNASFSGNSSGTGIPELNNSNRGCLSGENQSAWYYLSVAVDGTLEMSISPDGIADYDFAIWGPYTEATVADNCPPTGQPVRCSWARLPGGCNVNGASANNANGCANTGLGNGALDTSEGSLGNGWVAPLNVLAGEFYILIIDNFSISSVGYDVTWGGSAVLGCTEVNLPIELLSFTAKPKSDYNYIQWSTSSESNNDRFILDRSEDGVNWRTVEILQGAGNSSSKIDYFYKDINFNTVINYYRLTQIDFDGTEESFNIISVDNRNKRTLVKAINMMGQEVNENYRGLLINIYSDGTTEKIYK